MPCLTLTVIRQIPEIHLGKLARIVHMNHKFQTGF